MMRRFDILRRQRQPGWAELTVLARILMYIQHWYGTTNFHYTHWQQHYKRQCFGSVLALFVWLHHGSHASRQIFFMRVPLPWESGHAMAHLPAEQSKLLRCGQSQTDCIWLSQGKHPMIGVYWASTLCTLMLVCARLLPALCRCLWVWDFKE